MPIKVAAVILAAGGASRFGRPKQLLELDGETLVHKACRTALEAECEPVIVVLGANAPLICAAGLPNPVSIVENPEWERGMGGSLALGAKALGDADAVIILLADQPGVTPETLARMKRQWETGAASIVLCDHGDALGPPTLFAACHFAELADLDGDEGGRSVIRKHPDARAIVSAPEARWDIDEEIAWHRFTGVRSDAGQS